MKRPSEEGVALLTMLLLVAVMSAMAVAVLEDIRFSVRRTSNAEGVAQARWYALGAETLARQQVEVLAQTPPVLWNHQPRELPIDGGVIRITLADAGACFDLNSVVRGGPEAWLRHEPALLRYRSLLDALGFSRAEAEQLSESLADWIDTDAGRNLAGAEDETYLSRPAPYRTAGAPLSEVSELRAIAGYAPAAYARIRPFVCALPAGEGFAENDININALAPGQAPVLTMATGGALSPERARALIMGRPKDGWPSVQAFRAQADFKGSTAPLSLQSRYFALTAQVVWADGEAVMTSLLEASDEGAARLLARRWTVDE